MDSYCSLVKHDTRKILWEIWRQQPRTRALAVSLIQDYLPQKRPKADCRNFPAVCKGYRRHFRRVTRSVLAEIWKRHPLCEMHVLRCILNYLPHRRKRFPNGFYGAVRDNDIPHVRYALTQGLDPNISNQRGRTPLMIAARWRDGRMATLLTQYGACVAARDKNGRTVFHYAILAQNTVLFDLCLLDPRVRCRINERMQRGQAPLHLVLNFENVHMTRSVLSAKADVNVPESKVKGLCLPLEMGAYLNNAELCQLLLEHKAKVNAKDTDGSSALFRAVSDHNLPLVEMLLEHQADPNTTFEGESLLCLVTRRRRPRPETADVVKTLLAYKASAD